jgi:hypothetical protein
MMNSKSTVEKKDTAALYWFLAAMAFGMCFFYPLAALWYVYKTEYNQSLVIWWIFLSLILFLLERLAYKGWRRLAAQEFAEFKVRYGIQ